MESLQQRYHVGILNLRSVNPYVANALGHWSKGSDLKPVVPRVSAASCTWNPRALAGSSSFGMGGTNAHVLASVPSPRQPKPPSACLWQRLRCQQFFSLCHQITHICFLCQLGSRQGFQTLDDFWHHPDHAMLDQPISFIACCHFSDVWLPYAGQQLMHLLLL